MSANITQSTHKSKLKGQIIVLVNRTTQKQRQKTKQQYKNEMSITKRNELPQYDTGVNYHQGHREAGQRDGDCVDVDVVGIVVGLQLTVGQAQHLDHPRRLRATPSIRKQIRTSQARE